MSCLFNRLLYIHVARLVGTLVGKFAKVYIPRPLRSTILGLFSHYFKIRTQDAEHPLSEYSSIDSFFVRRLKTQIRPIDPRASHIVCPVDGVIQEWGRIQDNQLIQAKNQRFSAQDLLKDCYSPQFQNGDFITFYLAPSDCHRIFSPLSGHILKAQLIPGGLYPVREPAISQISRLYVKNERIITLLDTKIGRVAVVKVGAFNVGSISLPYDPTLYCTSANQEARSKTYPKPIISKGECLGRFHLGSTVICLFEEGAIKWESSLRKEEAIQYGVAIGTCRN